MLLLVQTLQRSPVPLLSLLQQEGAAAVSAATGASCCPCSAIAVPEVAGLHMFCWNVNAVKQLASVSMSVPIIVM